MAALGSRLFGSLFYAQVAQKTTGTKPAPRIPRVGDRVIPPRSQIVYEITHAGSDASDVNIAIPGTNWLSRNNGPDMLDPPK